MNRPKRHNWTQTNLLEFYPQVKRARTAARTSHRLFSQSDPLGCIVAFVGEGTPVEQVSKTWQQAWNEWLDHTPRLVLGSTSLLLKDETSRKSEWMTQRQWNMLRRVCMGKRLEQLYLIRLDWLDTEFPILDLLAVLAPPKLTSLYILYCRNISVCTVDSERFYKRLAHLQTLVCIESPDIDLELEDWPLSIPGKHLYPNPPPGRIPPRRSSGTSVSSSTVRQLVDVQAGYDHVQERLYPDGYPPAFIQCTEKDTWVTHGIWQLPVRFCAWCLTYRCLCASSNSKWMECKTHILGHICGDCQEKLGWKTVNCCLCKGDPCCSVAKGCQVTCNDCRRVFCEACRKRWVEPLKPTPTCDSQDEPWLCNVCVVST